MVFMIPQRNLEHWKIYRYWKPISIKKNLAFALDRLAIFQTKSVSSTGGLTVVQYYIASGTILFLLLLGMACYPMMQPYTSVMFALSRQGIGVETMLREMVVRI